MKLTKLLLALVASSVLSFSAFAETGTCEKKCDKEKKSECCSKDGKKCDKSCEKKEEKK